MKREIITTADGSSTIFLPEWEEHYHSRHGAIQEAYHVFIKNGLEFYLECVSGPKSISILETGFGTGLNALITLLEGKKKKIDIEYLGIEAYPVSPDEVEKLNYSSLFKEENAALYFNRLHHVNWEIRQEITPHFHLYKKQISFKEIDVENTIDIVFFDAFGPRVQPDLWTEEMFARMYKALKEGGVLVTYSAKGSVRRAMQAVGFTVQRLPGPPGKREMLRALK